MKRRIAPELIRRGRRLVTSIFRPDTAREVDEELAFHLEMRVRQYLDEGLDEEEARRRARAGFGDMRELRARCARLADEREGRMRRSAWYDGLRQDVGFALRQVVRNPGFTAVAVLTLALAIGANTAVFSVVHGVLLKPLPFEEPEELVLVWTRYLPSTGVDIPQFAVSPPELLDYRDASEAMESVTAIGTGRANVGGGNGDPESVPVIRAGRGLFELLGVEPALGRGFTDEEQLPGASPTAVLSHEFWVTRFGGDPEVAGRTFELDGAPTRIVGVLPEGVNFPNARVQVWTPLGLDEQNPGNRQAHWLLGVARIADGHDLESARAELETITASWNEAWEHHAAGHFLILHPIRDDLVGEARPVLFALLGAVGLVLLVACANVASLFLVRGETRAREMAVRTALGAGRGRLARQLLTEAFLVAATGGLLGLVVAGWGTPALLSIDPTAIPLSSEVAPSLPVMAFTLGLVVAVTLLFGSLPAFRAGRTDGPGGELARGRDPGRRERGGVRRMLVAAEVAVSLVVLVGAGLVTRSAWNLRSVDTGVQEDGLVTFALDLPPGRYGSAAEVVALYADLEDRLASLPGVVSVGAVSALPGTGVDQRWDVLREDDLGAAGERRGANAQMRTVRAGWFETAGIPVLRGRTIGPQDDATAVPIAVIDRTAAERLWPGQDPVGRRFTYDIDPPDDGRGRLWLTVVGVVDDVLNDLRGESQPHVYSAHAQLPATDLTSGRRLTMAVRATGTPAPLIEAARSIVRELDPSLPVARLATMAETLDGQVAQERLSANVFLFFGLAALLLAVLGVYGVVSYTVARRTREVGVRMALGASRPRVMRSMLTEGAAPAVVGSAVGVVLSLAAAPLVVDILFGVAPRDPMVIVAGTATILAVALAAAAVPARRATRVEPSRALREE